MLKHPTLNEQLGVGMKLAVPIYQAVILSIVAGASYLAPGDNGYLVSPLVGGLLVGGSQAVNLVLTGNALGGKSAQPPLSIQKISWLHSRLSDWVQWSSIYTDSFNSLRRLRLDRTLAHIEIEPAVQQHKAGLQIGRLRLWSFAWQSAAQ